MRISPCDARCTLYAKRPRRIKFMNTAVSIQYEACANTAHAVETLPSRSSAAMRPGRQKLLRLRESLSLHADPSCRGHGAGGGVRRAEGGLSQRTIRCLDLGRECRGDKSAADARLGRGGGRCLDLPGFFARCGQPVRHIRSRLAITVEERCRTADFGDAGLLGGGH